MKTASIALTAIFAFGLGVSSFNAEAAAGERSRRNAAIAVTAGLATIALLASASRSRSHDSGYVSRDGRSYCERLLDRCDNGSSRACEKYETGGCTE